ncbi:MAG: DUF6958 family protein [Saprospiraceae bacterium]
MEKSTIQTLHPTAGKQGRNISLEKYEALKSAILEVLQHANPTHDELMEALHERLHASFSGNVGWYAETVKLDLEARKIIERSDRKPIKYCLIKNT